MTSTKTYKPFLVAVGALIAFVGFLFIPNSANAEMIVSPPKFDFDARPGDVLQGTVLFKNNSQEVVQVFPGALNFTFKEGDETSGAPLTYPANEVRTGTELAPWIGFNSDPFVIEGGETVGFPFTIAIPEDATPGGHFGLIELIVGHPGVEGTGVGITGGVGSLIFLNVEGDVVEELSMENFSGDSYSYRHLPVFFTSRLKNTGNTHLRPVGNIFIKDMFGRQVASLSVNPAFQTILPNSTRRFETYWVKNQPRGGDSSLQAEMRNFALGKYEATAVVSYGDGKSVTAVYDFVVIPWLALAVWAAIILAVILLLTFGLKAYNRMIIKKFQNQKK